MSQDCISPDGKPTERAIELLRLLFEKEKLSDAEIAEILKRLFFR